MIPSYIFIIKQAVLNTVRITLPSMFFDICNQLTLNKRDQRLHDEVGLKWWKFRSRFDPGMCYKRSTWYFRNPLYAKYSSHFGNTNTVRALWALCPAVSAMCLGYGPQHSFLLHVLRDKISSFSNSSLKSKVSPGGIGQNLGARGGNSGQGHEYFGWNSRNDTGSQRLRQRAKSFFLSF